MPGMVAIGRKWNIATDDFALIGVVDTIFYFCWWCFSFSAYISFRNDGTCSFQMGRWSSLLQIFLVGSCSVHFLHTIISICSFVISKRGTLANPKPRESVSTVIITNILFSFSDVSLAILGIYLLRQRYTCKNFNVRLTLWVITIVFWFLALAKSAFVWLCYNKTGKIGDATEKMINNEHCIKPIPERAIKEWRWRLRLLFFLFCRSFGALTKNERRAINDVALNMASLYHDKDMVVTDWIAALMLYRRENLKEYKEVRLVLEAASPITLQDGSGSKSFPTPDIPAWMNFKLASRYFRISMGIRGWIWALYKYFPNALHLIWKHISCRHIRRRNLEKVVGDDFFGTNFACLLATSKCRYDDVVYASFINGVYEIPFFVVIDEETSSVVISLRSSVSSFDFLSNLSSTSSPVGDECLPDDALCFSSILFTARKIKTQLESLGILHKAFDGRENYRLVLTGDSLGAGVASMLTLLLRKSFPNIRCYAFSPFPILNAVALKETEDCIFSIFYGSDIAPYLSINNFEKFAVRCCKLLNECQLPKHKVFMRWLASEKQEEQCFSQTELSADDNLEPPQVGTKGIDTENEEECEELQFNSNSTDPIPSNQLLVAGKFVHIQNCRHGPRLRICKAEDLRTIHFFPGLCNHLPMAVESYLERLVPIE